VGLATVVPGLLGCVSKRQEGSTQVSFPDPPHCGKQLKGCRRYAELTDFCLRGGSVFEMGYNHNQPSPLQRGRGARPPCRPVHGEFAAPFRHSRGFREDWAIDKKRARAQGAGEGEGDFRRPMAGNPLCDAHTLRRQGTTAAGGIGDQEDHCFELCRCRPRVPGSRG
jgi:hypothetical protein